MSGCFAPTRQVAWIRLSGPAFHQRNSMIVKIEKSRFRPAPRRGPGDRPLEKDACRGRARGAQRVQRGSARAIWRACTSSTMSSTSSLRSSALRQRRLSRGCWVRGDLSRQLYLRPSYPGSAAVSGVADLLRPNLCRRIGGALAQSWAGYATLDHHASRPR